MVNAWAKMENGLFMKHIIISFCSLILAACTSSATPTLFNGNYYMAGDPKCVRMTPKNGTWISCMDKTGSFTGYRDAITYQQMQGYQHQQQIQMQQLGQQLQQVGQSYQNSGQQTLQQSQQYIAPQIQPITPYGSSSGTVYRRLGNTIVGSDGTRCQIAGQNVICN